MTAAWALLLWADGARVTAADRDSLCDADVRVNRVRGTGLFEQVQRHVRCCARVVPLPARDAPEGR